MKFNTNVKKSSEVRALCDLLTKTANDAGASSVSKFYTDDEGAKITFKLKGNKYDFSFLIDSEELEYSNADGAPCVRIVQIDDYVDGNLFCCETLEELQQSLSQL